MINFSTIKQVGIVGWAVEHFKNAGGIVGVGIVDVDDRNWDRRSQRPVFQHRSTMTRGGVESA